MIPKLFELGPITIYSFGFFLAVAYLAATFIFWREGKRQGYNEEKLLDFSIIMLIAALLGGRIYHVILNWNLFALDPISIFYFWQGGFGYFGALALALIAGIYFTKIWKWPFFQIADIVSLSAAAALVIGKIGAFLAGLDFGKQTDLPWAVTFPNLVGSRHPVQLYESGAYFLILIILYIIYYKNLSSVQMRSGKVFLIFLILTGLSRGILEFFRAQPVLIGGVPLATILSFLIASAAIFALYYFQFRYFRQDLRSFLQSFLLINDRVLKKLKL